MTAPAIIISAPADHRLDIPALQREFGRTIVKHNWHPNQPVIPGVLHITPMHPGDLEDAGVDLCTVILRGWPCPRDGGAPSARMPSAQHGHTLPTLLNWLAACLLALALGAAHLLDGPSDHSFEVGQARELEAAQRTEAARLAQDRAISRACSGGISGNAAWVDLPDGRHRCATNGGRATGTIVAGVRP